MLHSFVLFLPDTKMLETAEVQEFSPVTLRTAVRIFDSEAMKLHLLAVMTFDEVGLCYHIVFSSDPLDRKNFK